MFVLSAVVHLPLNVLLGKSNNKKDLSDVTTVLRVICSVQVALDIFVYVCSLFFLVREMVYDGIFSAEYIRVRNVGGLFLVLLIMLDCFVLHGVRIMHGGYLNVFLITHLILFGLSVIGTFYTVYTLTDLNVKAILIYLTISLITITLFLTRIGYKTALHKIFNTREKNKIKNNRITPSEAQYYVDEKWTVPSYIIRVIEINHRNLKMQSVLIHEIWKYTLSDWISRICWFIVGCWSCTTTYTARQRR